jgi:hypothetical protein
VNRAFAFARIRVPNYQRAKKLLAFCVTLSTLNRSNPIADSARRSTRRLGKSQNGKEAAAARSTGLRPIHFSNRGNGRGFNFRQQSLQNCNHWQEKFFARIRWPDVCNERASTYQRVIRFIPMPAKEF